MHLEIKNLGVGIIRVFTHGKYLPRDGIALCALFGVTIIKHYPQ